MKLAIDVGYHEQGATVAGVLFHDWTDPHPAEEHSILVENVEPYESGQFYKRELPCMLALLEQIEHEPEVIIVDGFVWLSKNQSIPKPGLGAYLYEKLEKRVPVIGVAKTEFAGSGAAELLRGGSVRPLYISAEGIDLADAVCAIQAMHGKHRFPTLLKRVDLLSRISVNE